MHQKNCEYIAHKIENGVLFNGRNISESGGTYRIEDRDVFER